MTRLGLTALNNHFCILNLPTQPHQGLGATNEGKIMCKR